MTELADLIERNRSWAEGAAGHRSEFLSEVHAQQRPIVLWIGCVDSRVPPETIVNAEPGELLVHRNIGNLVLPYDANCCGVIDYAVDHLQVSHIVVCGHTGCGGVKAATDGESHGRLDVWLRPIRDIRDRHSAELERMSDSAERGRRLCELNALRQAENVRRLPSVRKASSEGRGPSIFAWLYDLSTGRLSDLGCR